MSLTATERWGWIAFFWFPVWKAAFSWIWMIKPISCKRRPHLRATVRHHQPYHAESSTQNKHHRFLHSISATRLQDGENEWNTATYLRNNPIKHVEGNKYIIFRYYEDLIMTKINSEPHPYHRESMKYIFSSILCEIIAIVTKEVPKDETENKTKRNSMNTYFAVSLKSYRKTMECTARWAIMPMPCSTLPSIFLKSSKMLAVKSVDID